MVESRLGWFKHVSREPIEASVRSVDQMEDIPIGRWCHSTRLDHRPNRGTKSLGYWFN